jgi:HEAT repeat protein
VIVTYCPHCWAEIPRESSRCPYCGQPVETEGEDYVDKLLASVHHPEPTRAGLAIHILSEMLAEPRAVVPLIGLLDTACDTGVLSAAVVGLGRLGDPRAVPALARLLGNPETPLVARAAAVRALARIGGAEARVALQRALGDRSITVRERARRALARDEKDADTLSGKANA